MPNDAKCGLLVGVTLVIAVAVVFFRNNTNGTPNANQPSSTIAKSLTLPPVASPGTQPTSEPAAPANNAATPQPE